MKTFAEKVIHFNRELRFPGELPEGIRVMNPFGSPEIAEVTEQFYRKFYDDTHPRKLILGINPGRLGAGATGVPFTDTKRLRDICDIEINSFKTHEPSSVFIYDLIERYGGADAFYQHFYINSASPLGFIVQSPRGNWINCNYYDYPDLFAAVREFIVSSLKQQIRFGIDTTSCFVLGKKNAKFLGQYQ